MLLSKGKCAVMQLSVYNWLIKENRIWCHSTTWYAKNEKHFVILEKSENSFKYRRVLPTPKIEL